jgi:hypothetical protein
VFYKTLHIILKIKQLSTKHYTLSWRTNNYLQNTTHYPEDQTTIYKTLHIILKDKQLSTKHCTLSWRSNNYLQNTTHYPEGQTTIYKTLHNILKCYVNVCKTYQLLPLFLRFFNLILKLLWQCGVFCSSYIIYWYSLLDIFIFEI